MEVKETKSSAPPCPCGKTTVLIRCKGGWVVACPKCGRVGRIDSSAAKAIKHWQAQDYKYSSYNARPKK